MWHNFYLQICLWKINVYCNIPLTCSSQEISNDHPQRPLEKNLKIVSIESIWKKWANYVLL